MGDNKARSALHQVGHRLLNSCLRPGVNAAGGLVKNEDCRVGQDGPGNGQKLLLPWEILEASSLRTVS